VALLPISPFRPQQSKEPPHYYHAAVHMGPAEAVQAHLEVGAGTSIAAHFQVFQFGPEGFDDAVHELTAIVKERHLKPEAFVAPAPGRAIVPANGRAEAGGLASVATSSANR
jgi:hypothetical protein